MKCAQTYKGYFLDIGMQKGILSGKIQGSDIQIQGTTVKDLISQFKKVVDMAEGKPA